MLIPGISGNRIDSHATTASSATTKFGMPLTGSMSALRFTLVLSKDNCKE